LRKNGGALRKKPRSTRRPSERSERLDHLVKDDCNTNYWYFLRFFPMSKNTSITLGEHFDSFVSEQLENGRYASTSEVVRAGLRLLEEEETKLSTLRKLLEVGEASEFVEYSLSGLIKELDSETH
jgi:antitoxin ParD1/3/4